MLNLTIKTDELERNMIEFHNHVKANGNENDRVVDEMNMRSRQTLKSNRYETCDSLRNKIESLHENLSKFTKGKENI